MIETRNTRFGRLKIVAKLLRLAQLAALISIVMAVSVTPLFGEPSVTVADAISMVRVQQYLGPVATFSPDGSKFATVVWHGDLARNVNVYSLLVFDARRK